VTDKQTDRQTVCLSVCLSQVGVLQGFTDKPTDTRWQHIPR